MDSTQDNFMEFELSRSFKNPNEFCIWARSSGLKGIDNKPLYFLFWKWQEKHNTKKRLWNKYGVQRVWGDVYLDNEGERAFLNDVPAELHKVIIYGLFTYTTQSSMRIEDIMS